MKKILWSIAILIWIGLAGCGGASPDSGSSSSGQPTVPSTPPPADLAPGPLLDLLTDYERAQDNIRDIYKDVGTHPFFASSHDPLSTFGVDVDTASYDIFRRDLQNYARLPKQASVRVEDYINYFEYGYPMPSPDEGHPFKISLGSAPSLFGQDTHLLRIGIQAAIPATAKKPANLVFLIDRSGSMNEKDKFPLVKRVLTEALDILDPTDTITLVAYAGAASVILEPTMVSQKYTIIDAIGDLELGGFTDGGAGIELAYQRAEAAYIEGGINHVILCTDGDFVLGQTSDEALIKLIEEKRETGVTFTALGFGSGSLNDAMMEATSNAGNGTYAVITSESHAVDYAHNRLASNLRYLAKDMKVQVEFNPQLVSHYRQIGYENRAIEDDEFREDEGDAGEIGVGHRVTALYELVLTGDVLPEAADAPKVVEGENYAGPVEVASDDYVLVKVRYKAVDATTEDPAKEVSSSLKILDTPLSAADADLRWAVAMAAFAEILKGSPFAERAYLEQLGVIFAEQSERDADRAEFYQLFQLALPKLSDASGS